MPGRCGCVQNYFGAAAMIRVLSDTETLSLDAAALFVRQTLFDHVPVNVECGGRAAVTNYNNSR